MKLNIYKFIFLFSIFTVSVYAELIEDYDSLRTNILKGTLSIGYKLPAGRKKELRDSDLSLNYSIYNLNAGLIYQINPYIQIGGVFDFHSGSGTNTQIARNQYEMKTDGKSLGIGGGLGVNAFLFQRTFFSVSFENQFKVIHFIEQLKATTEQNISLWDYTYSNIGLSLTSQLNLNFAISKRQTVSAITFYDHSTFFYNDNQLSSHHDLTASFETPYYNTEGSLKNSHSGFGIGVKYSVWFMRRNKKVDSQEETKNEIPKTPDGAKKSSNRKAVKIEGSM